MLLPLFSPFSHFRGLIRHILDLLTLFSIPLSFFCHMFLKIILSFYVNFGYFLQVYIPSHQFPLQLLKIYIVVRLFLEVLFSILPLILLILNNPFFSFIFRVSALFFHLANIFILSFVSNNANISGLIPHFVMLLDFFHGILF